MEPTTIFALVVGFIGAFDLLSRAISAFSKGRHASVTAPAKKRDDDWYCFFKLSSLLGQDWVTSQNREHQDPSQNKIIEEHKRRQQAQRPRLSAQ